MAIFNVEETFCKSTAEVLLCKLVTLIQYHKFILSFNCCRVNKGVVISKQTVVLHRWENTLAKISGTVGYLQLRPLS